MDEVGPIPERLFTERASEVSFKFFEYIQIDDCPETHLSEINNELAFHLRDNFYVGCLGECESKALIELMKNEKSISQASNTSSTFQIHLAPLFHAVYLHLVFE